MTFLKTKNGYTAATNVLADTYKIRIKEAIRYKVHADAIPDDLSQRIDDLKSQLNSMKDNLSKRIDRMCGEILYVRTSRSKKRLMQDIEHYNSIAYSLGKLFAMESFVNRDYVYADDSFFRSLATSFKIKFEDLKYSMFYYRNHFLYLGLVLYTDIPCLTQEDYVSIRFFNENDEKILELGDFSSIAEAEKFIEPILRSDTARIIPVYRSNHFISKK